MKKLVTKLIIRKTFFLLTTVFLFLTSANAQWTGAGTAANPYLITNHAELKSLSAFVMSDPNFNLNGTSANSYGKYWKLMNDINMAGVTDFTPIGGWSNTTTTSPYKIFGGTFDGNNKKILNLVINKPTDDYVGLFGKALDATILNLGIEGGSIIGNSYVGGLVGYGSYFSNCYSTNNVTGNGDIGGLVGYNIGTISNCYSSGLVTSNGSGGSVGGLAGYVHGSISNCYATGTVKGNVNNSIAGGLVGIGYSISNCYATGTVTGYNAGGLAGSSSSISNCYAIGTVNGSNNVGGLVGNSSSITNCYASNSVIANGTNCRVGGLAGTANSISNCYATNNVSCSGSESEVGGLVGEADGLISNCCATGTVSGGKSAGGLVGDNEGDISNCYAKGAVTSGDYAGGLVGYNSSGSGYTNTISDCYATGTINGSSAGGLVGVNYEYISNCYATGTVSGSFTAGGLVGSHLGYYTISNCYASGTVSSSRAGGFVGKNSAKIYNCYATNSVVGTGGDYNVGGFVGDNDFGGHINNCYAAPNSITSTSTYKGIFMGRHTAGPLTNCYYSTALGINGIGYGGTSSQLIGKTDAQLKAAAMVATPGSASNSLNYNQSSPYPWKVDLTPNVNKGFPICSWQLAMSGNCNPATNLISIKIGTSNKLTWVMPASKGEETYTYSDFINTKNIGKETVAGATAELTTQNPDGVPICLDGNAVIFDGAESHTNFTKDSPGTLGWKYYNNGSTTYGFDGVTFPGSGTAFAYIVFVPSATTPASGATALQPRTGSKYFACFATNVTMPNNHWIVSPQINSSGAFTFSFYAKTYISDYGLERMKVLYSTTNDSQASFTNYLAGSASTYVSVPVASYTLYTYTVPATAKYVAIQCVSNDAFLFMVDDITITTPGGGDPLSVNIYRNGTKIASNVTGTSYTDNTPVLSSCYKIEMNCSGGGNSIMSNEACVTTTFTITAMQGANGTLTPPGITTVNYGGSQTFTINANAEYEINEILVNGVRVNNINDHITTTTYKFENVAANHTISITFRRIVDIQYWTLNAKIFSFNKTINIELENSENANFEIIDITGRIIKKGEFVGNTKIDVDTQGVYFVKVVSNQMIKVQKVVLK